MKRDQDRDETTQWMDKPIPEIIDFILKKHHAYTRKQMKHLLDLSEKQSGPTERSIPSCCN